MLPAFILRTAIVRFSKQGGTALLFVALVLCLHAAITHAQVKAVRRVLILNEVGTSYPVINLIDQGIRSALAASPYKIEFYREYMDTVEFPKASEQKLFRNFYIQKYRNRRPDVIITVGSSPLKFMIETHRHAFAGIPAVFCLPNRLQDRPVLDSDFTGVEGDIAPAATVAAALRLLPSTKYLFVVGGMALFDRRQLASVEQQLKTYENRVDVSYATDLAMPVLLERLSHLPSHTIVLMTALGKDATGMSFTSNEVGPLIVSASNVPVFSLSDRFFNHGEVGGAISSGVDQGRVAGSMALRILNGEKPERIPAVKSATTYTFDWRALKRWGLKERELPPGSIVVNRQPTVWEKYQWYIACTAVVIFAEALLIVGLIWQRERRRKAETKLAITYDRLNMAIEAGRFVGWDLDIRTRKNRWFGDFQGMFGIPADTFWALPGDFKRRVHPDDIDRVSRAIDDARNKRQPCAAEFRILRADGTQHWVIARGKFYYANNGDPERMLGLALDITDRKLAEEALRTVSRRLIQAQEQERTRIARELHDDITQRLASFNVELANVIKHIADSPGGNRTAAERLPLRISDIASDIQEISHRLHSSKLEYLGLIPACKSVCKEFSERHNVNVEFKADTMPEGVSQNVSLSLFRILQESLQNGTKHGGARDFEVRLRGTPRDIQLVVRDNGKGFDVETAVNSRGLGLISMRERVSLVNGTIYIESKPMSGTQINVRVPINRAAFADPTTLGAA